MSRAEFMKEEAEALEVEVSELEEYFSYLEELRESGIVNMFGASPYLAEVFDLTKTKSRKVLSSWMRSYSEVKEEV